MEKIEVEIEKVLGFLSTIYKLTPECCEDLKKFIRRETFRKGDIILKIGDVNTRLYFIMKGAAICSYYVGEEEVVDWFFFEEEFFVSIGSFYEQVPSEDCIVAHEDCDLLYMTHEQYEYLCEKHHCFSNLARILLQKYLIVFHNHPRFIRRHTATERLKIAAAKLGHLYYRIPRTIVASWLGMNRSTLSRNQ